MLICRWRGDGPRTGQICAWVSRPLSSTHLFIGLFFAYLQNSFSGRTPYHATAAVAASSCASLKRCWPSPHACVAHVRRYRVPVCVVRVFTTPCITQENNSPPRTIFKAQVFQEWGGRSCRVMRLLRNLLNEIFPKPIFLLFVLPMLWRKPGLSGCSTGQRGRLQTLRRPPCRAAFASSRNSYQGRTTV